MVREPQGHHSDEDEARQAAAAAGAPLSASAETESGPDAYVRAMLGRASLAAAAVAYVRPPERGTQRSPAESRALVVDIVNVLQKHGISVRTFMDGLGNTARRRTVSIFLDSDVEDEQLQEAFGGTTPGNVNRSAKIIMQIARQQYPDIITDELIGDADQSATRDASLRLGYVAGVLGEIIDRAKLEQARLAADMGWSESMLSRLLNGRSRAKPAQFEALLRRVNAGLASLPPIRLERAGLRPLTDEEVEQLIQHYAKEWNSAWERQQTSRQAWRSSEPTQ